MRKSQSGQAPHRPGPLHQTNKLHKGSRHSRKSSIVSEIKSKSRSKANASQRREERLNHASQIRKLKREKALENKRKYGFEDNSPLFVGVLDPYANITKSFFENLKELIEDTNVLVEEVNERSLYVVCHRLKTRFKFVMLDTRNSSEALDLVKSMDLMVMLHRIDHLTHSAGFNCDELLNIIRIHCLPTTVHILDNISGTNVKNDPRRIIEAKRTLKSMLEVDKMHSLEKSQDFFQLFHLLGNCKRLSSRFKEARAAILTDRMLMVDGSVVLEGFVRHKTLSPNNLVHVMGHGDFQIEEINIISDPVSLRSSQSRNQDSTGDMIAAFKPDPVKQETLEEENEVDPMDGEQTWPTAMELAAEVEKRNTKKLIRRLPPGTSDYQGAWINEDSDLDNSDSDSDSGSLSDDQMLPLDDDGSASEMSHGNEDKNEENEETGAELSESATNLPAVMEVDDYDKNHSTDRERKIHEKIKEARMNEMFPDEVDTPADTPARVRFARYRGLKSFRTSPWDPQENLPPDYNRIFQFQNFKQTRRRVMNEGNKEGASPGTYVRVHLANVPPEVSTNIVGKTVPPNAVQLLRYERKMTVMNFLIKRVAGADLSNPVESKDELEFHVGFRRFLARPVLTAHSIATNKFKYEKFLRDDAAMVATVYAPITFPPAPVLVFRDGELVASGSVLDSNPSRLIIKRIKLSGHPFKIYSKTAVIRFMFFNSEDVLYFKPVELVTRYNRRGHITEPLGTHGHMKCTFDRKIRSDDCVFMNLYKRIFPKWTYTPLNHG